MARPLKTANLTNLWPWRSARAFQKFQEFPAPIGLKKFLQFLRGGASSHTSETYQTMAMARRHGPSEISGIPGTNRAPEIPEIRCDRVLSPEPTSATLSQDAWTLPKNFMLCYSNFSAKLIRPTGAIYLRDS